MKILIIVALFWGSVQGLSSQYWTNSDDSRSRFIAFQVAPGIVYFDGIKYGFDIGVNIKQIVSLAYFHFRDYGVDKFRPHLDNRAAGFHLSLAQSVSNNIELAIGARRGTLNSEPQKTIFTGEVRYKFKESWRLALEFGGNNNKSMTGLRLIFNLD
ncbi:MAG: hypothetical protein HWE07_10740 [Cytophagia bacterium]|nr:hypothetical protein [Cytophagia bacterium]